MIQRINFVEKAPFEFTYTRIIQIGVVCLILAASFHGVQFGRVLYLEHQIEELEVKKDQIKESNRKLEKFKPKKVKKTTKDTGLKKVFVNTPQWSAILKDFTARLPETVWFTIFRSSGAQSSGDSGKSKKKNPKVEQASSDVNTRSLTLTGMAGTLGDLTTFVTRLKKSPYVTKADFNSVKEEQNFSFVIKCQINPTVK